MKKWKTSDNYLGVDMSNYWVIYSRNVNQTSITIDSNYGVILDRLKSIKNMNYEFYFGSWASPFETIMIEDIKENKKVIDMAEIINEELNNNILLDEYDFFIRLSKKTTEKYEFYKEHPEIAVEDGLDVNSPDLYYDVEDIVKSRYE